MNPIACLALSKLLKSAENASGRETSLRQISFNFAPKALPSYWELNNAERMTCHGALLHAEREGAIEIRWDRRAGERNQVEKILLRDRDALARVLGIDPLWDLVTSANNQMKDLFDRHPVLVEVIDAWRRGKSVCNTIAQDVGAWMDAVAVIDHCRQNGVADVPVRRLSAALNLGSKRVESLYRIIDALVQGDISSPAREQEDVFSSIGLVKFPPTLLISGDLCVNLANGQSLLVACPYMGVAPAAVESIGVDKAHLIHLLTVENLTTFHELALRRAMDAPNTVLLYTGGWPSPSWRRVYTLLLSHLPPEAKIFHWGDVDGSGFGIADTLASCCEEAGRNLRLHAMALETNVSSHDVFWRALEKSEMTQIERICSRRGWEKELAWVARNQRAIEQESIPVIWP
jgi:hypothetical protein